MPRRQKITSHQTNFSNHEEPIVALCTPQGPGVIALIRISGVGAVSLVARLAVCSSGLTLDNAKSHTIHHGSILDHNGTVVDEVLFLVMLAPKTYTGQDTVEISCHNNPIIIDRIIESVIHVGARPAGPGEYTQRAYLEGKMKLEQAEAVHGLICAQNQESLKRLGSQLRGSLSRYLAELEKKLVKLAVLLEAQFEFIDEEARDVGMDEFVKDHVEKLSEYLVVLELCCEKQSSIRRGAKIVIAGPANAGKSTLFNVLAGESRAIVSDVAGTTRDHIESTIMHDGNLWSLVDTAGLRKTSDIVEQMGIKKTYGELDSADMILFVVDGTLDSNIPQTYREKTVVVVNKCDLGTKVDSNFVVISAKQGVGIEKLRSVITSKLKELCDTSNAPFVLNERQRPLIRHAISAFEEIRTKIDHGIDYEVVSQMVRALIKHLSGITGKDVDRKVVDEIFSSFCVGK